MLIITVIDGIRYVQFTMDERLQASQYTLNKKNQYYFLFAKCGAPTFFILVTACNSAQSRHGVFAQISYQRYLEILAVTMIVGWMQTLTYFKFISKYSVTLDHFWNIILENIIGMFIAVYMLVVVGFGLALHALNLTELEDGDYNRTVTDSIYYAFTNMLSLTSSISDLTTGYKYEKDGGSIDFLRFVFSAYVCISTIILLNLLIAMMNQTYTNSTNMKEDSKQKMVSTLKYSLWVDNKIRDHPSWPKLAKVLRFVSHLSLTSKVINKNGRFCIWTRKTDYLEVRKLNSEELSERRHKTVANNLGSIKSKLNELDEIKTSIEKIRQSLKGMRKCKRHHKHSGRKKYDEHSSSASDDINNM